MRARYLMIAALLATLMTPFAVQAQDGHEPFTQAELDQMLAPVALYPDTVLSHILISATYPLEVVQAARWVEGNPGLEGEAAVEAVQDKGWDESVKALVAFPELLERMSDNLEWTQRLGDAFLEQEGEVLDSIQGLRRRADTAGKLETNEHVEVVREREVIYIEPRSPRVVYVPYYDPWVAYGHWWWPAHPPMYWSHPPGFHSSVTFHWSRGHRVSPFFYTSSFHWFNRHVVVIHHHHVHRARHKSARQIVHHRDAKRWQHKPKHRRSVPYRSSAPRVSGPPRSSPRHAPRSERRDWAQERRRGMSQRQQSRPDPSHVQTRAREQTEPTFRAPRQQRPRRGTDATSANGATNGGPGVNGDANPRPSFQSRPQAQSQPQRSRPQVQPRPQVQSRPSPRLSAPQRSEPRQSAPSRSGPQQRNTPQRSAPQRSAPQQNASPPRQSSSSRASAPQRQSTPQRPARSPRNSSEQER